MSKNEQILMTSMDICIRYLSVLCEGKNLNTENENHFNFLLSRAIPTNRILNKINM